MTKKVFVFLGVFVMLAAVAGFALTGSVHAASSALPSYVPTFLQQGNNVGTNQIDVLIRNIINFIFAIAGLLVLGFIIFAGFKFITSGGDASKKEEAQKQIVAAVIGLLIIVFSFFIVQLVFSLLGIQIQNIAVPCPPGVTPGGTENCIADTGTTTVNPTL